MPTPRITKITNVTPVSMQIHFDAAGTERVTILDTTTGKTLETTFTQSPIRLDNKITEIIPGVTYTFQLAAKYPESKTYKLSEPVKISTKLPNIPPVTGLKQHFDADNIQLSWDPHPRATYYGIQQIRGSQIEFHTSTLNTWKSQPLPPGSNYSYTVRALNKNEGSAYSPAIQTQTPPATPEIKSTVAEGRTSATVLTIPVTGADKYRLQVSATRSVRPTTIEKDVIIFKLTDLSPNTVYNVRVAAENSCGTSPFSEPAQFITEGKVPTVEKIWHQVVDNTIRLSWTEVLGAEKYRIYYGYERHGKYDGADLSLQNKPKSIHYIEVTPETLDLSIPIHPKAVLYGMRNGTRYYFGIMTIDTHGAFSEIKPYLVPIVT